jgi:hypothetical protein
MRVSVTLERSEDPDDRRLPEPLDFEVEVPVLPRAGEHLELPWPLAATRPTRRVLAQVMMVEFSWPMIDADAPGPERVPVLVPRITAMLWDPDIGDSDGA